MFNVYNIFEIIIIKDMDNLNVKKYEEVWKKNEVELQKKLGEFKNITDMGSDTEGELLEEEADEAEELVINAGEKQILKERLADVQGALRKIAAGSYSKCEKCGEMIENEVLDLVPESKYCRVHKMS